MRKKFLEEIASKHQVNNSYPPTSSVTRLITKLLLILFPEQAKKHYSNPEEIEKAFQQIQDELSELLVHMQDQLNKDAFVLSSDFINRLETIYELLKTDIDALLQGDPAAKSEFEVIRTYPGFYATAFYRIAHELYKLQIPLIPRILTEYAHSKTGIDIHPGAQINSHFFIDHGTGIVIGETAIIGKNVKLYQGVTLGALSVSKDLAETKRHPTIEDNVVIYAGATILGGRTIVGKNSVIGGNVWITSSVPENSKVYHQASLKFSE